MACGRTTIVITAADDYPLHQTSRPFRDPGVDRNLYDRFFFCGYPISGEDAGAVYFAVALGQYPGRNVMDGAFSIVADGVQHNVRGSRLLGDDRLDLRAGPVKVEIVEPMRTLHVTVDAPEAGVFAELTFRARGPAFEEPHYRWSPGNLTVMDITRLTQNGTWSGSITVGDRTIAVECETWRGTRDRSWGIRGVGNREPSAAPDGPGPQFFWLWTPLNFDDLNVIFDVNENADGSAWHGGGLVAANSVTADVAAATPTYAITWRPGTRHADGFHLSLAMPDRTVGIKLRSRLTFYMQGIGYGHPTWGHGMYVGPDERSHDQLVTTAVDETDLGFQHVQILSDATLDDGSIGMGILEMYLIGPHAPSGFSGFTDMHP